MRRFFISDADINDIMDSAVARRAAQVAASVEPFPKPDHKAKKRGKPAPKTYSARRMDKRIACGEVA